MSEPEKTRFTKVINLTPAVPSPELVMDALLIVVKANQNAEFDHWNQSIVAPAVRIVDAATDAAIARFVAATKN